MTNPVAYRTFAGLLCAGVLLLCALPVRSAQTVGPVTDEIGVIRIPRARLSRWMATG
jgi:hypothetical protein